MGLVTVDLWSYIAAADIAFLAAAVFLGWRVLR